MARVVAAASLWVVLATARAGAASAEQQNIIVDCGERCDAVAAALRRMGGEVSAHGDGLLAVRIQTERLPEVPMVRGVSAAFKNARDSAAGPVVSPGKGVALEAARPGLVRTAGAADRVDAVQGSANAAPATAAGKIAQNDLVPVLVNVPPGTRELSFVLLWDEAFSEDIDLIVLAPDGNTHLSGATLRNPERAVVRNPLPGVWTAFVNGFAMNGRADLWELGVTADGAPLAAR